MASSSRRARVVCGVSHSSGPAVGEFSKALSDMLGAELVLVHVADSSNPGSSGPTLPFDSGTYRSGALERGAILLQECVGPALTDGARGRVELGDPVPGLVHAATDENASLLVLGWRGRRLFGGRLIGRLMRRSPCPLVLVRSPARG